MYKTLKIMVDKLPTSTGERRVSSINTITFPWFFPLSTDNWDSQTLETFASKTPWYMLTSRFWKTQTWAVFIRCQLLTLLVLLP